MSSMHEDVLDSTCFPYYGLLDMLFYAKREARMWASTQGGRSEITRRPVGLWKGLYKAVICKD